MVGYWPRLTICVYPVPGGPMTELQLRNRALKQLSNLQETLQEIDELNGYANAEWYDNLATICDRLYNQLHNC